MLNKNTKKSTALKFLLSLSATKVYNSFAHPNCKSTTVIIISTKCNPELRNQEKCDIILPLLPSSGKMYHYNSDQLSLVSDWFSENSKANFFLNSVCTSQEGMKILTNPNVRQKSAIWYHSFHFFPAESLRSKPKSITREMKMVHQLYHYQIHYQAD